MKKSIALIELYQHDEVLRHYCEMLSDGRYNIKVFCSKDVYKLMSEFSSKDLFEWQVMKRGESIDDFLTKHRDKFKRVDLIYITTAQDNFKKFYELSKLSSTLLLVHNAHSFLDLKSSIKLRSFKDYLRWAKLSLNQTVHYKKLLLNSLIGLAFPDQTVLNYVQQNFNLNDNLSLLDLPLAYYKNGIQLQQFQGKLNIVIPCTVTSKIRNYLLIYQEIKRIKKELTYPLRLILLGKPKHDGYQIIKKVCSLESKSIEVVSFQQTIPSDLYTKYLDEADLLILPVKEVVQHTIYQERLGFSKITGGINDMIKAGKPALIPDFYPVHNKLEEVVIRYNESNLGDKLLSWINTEPENEQSNREIFEECFSKKKLKDAFYKQLEQLF